MNNEYYMTAKTGDIVQMPGGTLGIVTHWDILSEGPTKEVRVFPFTNLLHRIYLTLTCRTTFYDRDISKLTPIHLAPEKAA